MTNRMNRYIQVAREEAALSTHPKARLGALIFHKGVIVGRGYNKVRTHPLVKRWYPKYNYHLHAEMDAVIRSRGEVSGCDIIVVRILKDGSLALSKPCPHCLSMLIAHGLRHLYYVNENGLLKKERL